MDDYGRQLKGGETCLRAKILEKDREKSNTMSTGLQNKVWFVLKESVVYQYVPCNEEALKVIIQSEDNTDIIGLLWH